MELQEAKRGTVGLGALRVGLPSVNHDSEDHSHGQTPGRSARVYVNVYTCMSLDTRSIKPMPVICSPKEVGRGRDKLDSASPRKTGGIWKASHGEKAIGPGRHGSLRRPPPPHTYGVCQGDQRILGLLSPTAATSCTFRAARASASLGRFAGTFASACCWLGSSCSSVSSRG